MVRRTSIGMVNMTKLVWHDSMAFWHLYRFSRCGFETLNSTYDYTPLF